MLLCAAYKIWICMPNWCALDASKHQVPLLFSGDYWTHGKFPKKKNEQLCRSKTLWLQSWSQAAWNESKEVGRQILHLIPGSKFICDPLPLKMVGDYWGFDTYRTLICELVWPVSIYFSLYIFPACGKMLWAFRVRKPLSMGSFSDGENFSFPVDP